MLIIVEFCIYLKEKGYLCNLASESTCRNIPAKAHGALARWRPSAASCAGNCRD